MTDIVQTRIVHRDGKDYVQHGNGKPYKQYRQPKPKKTETEKQSEG